MRSYIVCCIIYNFVDDFFGENGEKKNFYINGNSAFIDWIRCNYRVKIYNKIGEKNGKKNNWQHKI